MTSYPSKLALLVFAITAAINSTLPISNARAEDPSPTLSKFDSLSPDLRNAGWQQLRVKGRAVADFSKQANGVIAVATSKSAGFLYRSLNENESKAKSLKWSWRVDTAPRPSDLTRRGRDDRPIAVHIWFPVLVEDASPWAYLKSGISNLIDMPYPGKILTYVWGGTQAKGSKLRNPYLNDDGAIIVLRSGKEATGIWINENVDIAADYRMAFGSPPPPASYLVISADTDDRSGRSMAAVKSVAFDG